MTPQSKLEHIIYLVREYEKELKSKRGDLDHYNEIHHSILTAGSAEDSIKQSLSNLGGPPVIKIPAKVYLERIEAFLSKE